jgi:hypothetical protein
LLLLDAPFEAAPRKLADLQLRFQGITWSSNRLALIEETRWTDRKRIILGVFTCGIHTSGQMIRGRSTGCT